jgi:hypothetical protein
LNRLRFVTQNPPRTWVRAALAYCRQNPGSTACAAVRPRRDTDNTDATANAPLFSMSLLPRRPDLIPRIEYNGANTDGQALGVATRMCPNHAQPLYAAMTGTGGLAETTSTRSPLEMSPEATPCGQPLL